MPYEKTYSELMSIDNYADRFKYLQLSGSIGAATFGSHRWLNQKLYTSDEWKRFRRDMFIRDSGCDMGCAGFELLDSFVLHHMNPITIDDIVNRSSCVFDPENVICVSLATHKAIHYGDMSTLPDTNIERKPNDTCPWK